MFLCNISTPLFTVLNIQFERSDLNFPDSNSLGPRNESPQPGPSTMASRRVSITQSIAPSIEPSHLINMKHNPAFITGINMLLWLICVPLIGFSSQIIHSNLEYHDDLRDFKWQLFRKLILETVLFRILSPVIFIFKRKDFRSFAAFTISDWIQLLIYCNK